MTPRKHLHELPLHEFLLAPSIVLGYIERCAVVVVEA